MTKTLKWLGGGLAAAMLLGLAGLFSAELADAQTPPSGLPHRFAGTVSVDGEGAAAGTSVTASVNGTECGSITVVNNVTYGATYAVDVPASCAEAGDTVSFQVGGYDAAETGTWAGGTRSDINLTASTGMVDDDMGEDDPAEPGGDDPAEPGGDDPAEPGGDDPAEPGGDDPAEPGGDDPAEPGGDDPAEPGDDPAEPGADDPAEPGDDADVDETDMDETDMDETDMDETDMDETDMDETDMDETDMDETDMDETDMDETDMDETDMDETDMDETDMDETDMDETDMDETTAPDVADTGTGLATSTGINASLAAILGLTALAVLLGGYTVARRRS